MSVYRVTSESELWQKAGIYAVRVDASVYGDGFPLKLEIDEKEGEFYRYVMLTDRGKPIAACRLVKEEDTGKIERVSVIRERQRKGVGRELIKAAEDWAKELGISRIVITSRESVVGFYEKLGYQTNPKVDLNRPGPDGKAPMIRCTYMEKTI